MVDIIAEARSLARTRWEQLKTEQKDTLIDPADLYPYGGDQQESLVGHLDETFKISAHYGSTDWIDAEQAESLPGIGASYSRSQPSYGFSQLAAEARQPGSSPPDTSGLS